MNRVERLLALAADVQAPTGVADDDARARERAARVCWSMLAEPGDRFAGALVAELGAAEALELVAAEAVPAPLQQHPELGEALKRWRPRVVVRELEAAMRIANTLETWLSIPGDPDWPAGVDDLGAHAPLCLWTRGAPERALAVVEGPGVAIVGARAASAYGEHIANELTAGVCDRGITAVSGAAFGIDGVVHRTALHTGGGTIAFLAGGIDRAYPSAHSELLTRVCEQGAVRAEVLPGTAPTRWRFLARNRLIAASARATVVVEAGWRSGSLNTAHHAATLGRPIGAVPGPVTSPSSVGCHRLLREGIAVCVTQASDVAELLGGLDAVAGRNERAVAAHGGGAAAPGLAPPSSPTGTRVRDALSRRSPRGVADIAKRAGLTIAEVQAELGVLELDGASHRTADGRWRSGPA